MLADQTKSGITIRGGISRMLYRLYKMDNQESGFFFIVKKGERQLWDIMTVSSEICWNEVKSCDLINSS